MEITPITASAANPSGEIYSGIQTFWREFELINMEYMNYSVVPKLFSVFFWNELLSKSLWLDGNKF